MRKTWPMKAPDRKPGSSHFNLKAIHLIYLIKIDASAGPYKHLLKNEILCSNFWTV